MLNQMLRDLEQRKSTETLVTDRVFQQVSATEISGSEKFRAYRSFVRYFLALLLMAMTGYFSVQLLGTAYSPLNQHNVSTGQTIIHLPIEKKPVIKEEPSSLSSLASLKLSEHITPVAETPKIREFPMFQLEKLAVKPQAVKKESVSRHEEKPNAKQKLVFKTPVIQLSAEDKANHLYQEAIALFDSAKPELAIEQLQNALAIKQNLVPARLLLVHTYLEADKVLKAERLIDEGLSINPNQIDLILEKADLLVQRGELPRALGLINQVTVPVEQAIELYAFKASLLRRTDQLSASINLYKQLLRVEPEQPQWQAGLAISLDADQQASAALKAFTNALQSGKLSEPLNTYVANRIEVLEGMQH